MRLEALSRRDTHSCYDTPVGCLHGMDLPQPNFKCSRRVGCKAFMEEDMKQHDAATIHPVGARILPDPSDEARLRDWISLALACSHSQTNATQPHRWNF